MKYTGKNIRTNVYYVNDKPTISERYDTLPVTKVTFAPRSAWWNVEQEKIFFLNEQKFSA